MRCDPAGAEHEVDVLDRRADEELVETGLPGVRGDRPGNAECGPVAGVEPPGQVRRSRPLGHECEVLVVEAQARAHRTERQEIEHRGGLHASSGEFEERDEGPEDGVDRPDGAVDDAIAETGNGRRARSTVLARPPVVGRRAEAGLDQRSEAFEVRAEHDDVVLGELRIGVEQVEQGVACDLDLAQRTEARVELHAAIGRVEPPVAGGGRVRADRPLEPGEQRALGRSPVRCSETLGWRDGGHGAGGQGAGEHRARLERGAAPRTEEWVADEGRDQVRCPEAASGRRTAGIGGQASRVEGPGLEQEEMDLAPGRHRARELEEVAARQDREAEVDQPFREIDLEGALAEHGEQPRQHLGRTRLRDARAHRPPDRGLPRMSRCEWSARAVEPVPPCPGLDHRRTVEVVAVEEIRDPPRPRVPRRPLRDGAHHVECALGLGGAPHFVGGREQRPGHPLDTPRIAERIGAPGGEHAVAEGAGNARRMFAAIPSPAPGPDDPRCRASSRLTQRRIPSDGTASHSGSSGSAGRPA